MIGAARRLACEGSLVRRLAAAVSGTWPRIRPHSRPPITLSDFPPATQDSGHFGGWPPIGPLTDGRKASSARVERHPDIAVAWPQPWRGGRVTPDTEQGIAPLNDQNDRLRPRSRRLRLRRGKQIIGCRTTLGRLGRVLPFGAAGPKPPALSQCWHSARSNLDLRTPLQTAVCGYRT